MEHVTAIRDHPGGSMRSLSLLLSFAAGSPLPEEDDGPARRLQLGALAWLFALGFAAVFGAAAGSSQLMLAAGNLIKVPVVVLLSSLCALPAGFLAWKLAGEPLSGSNLLLSFGSAVFSGTLVLAAAAPLVALYYHTSAWAGPALGIGSVFVALIVACTLFIRGSVARKKPTSRRRQLIAPVVALLFMHVATLLQLVALASPILPETTVFDGGIDRVVQ
jgi:hypothetical protein